MPTTTTTPSTEARLAMLEALATMQMRLDSARDEIYDLRRDGDAEIEKWREKHQSAVRQYGWLLIVELVTLAAAVAGWAR